MVQGRAVQMNAVIVKVKGLYNYMAKESKHKALKTKLGSFRKILDSAGRHVFTRVKEHNGWKTYNASKGGVDEHA